MVETRSSKFFHSPQSHNHSKKNEVARLTTQVHEKLLHGIESTRKRLEKMMMANLIDRFALARVRVSTSFCMALMTRVVM